MQRPKVTVVNGSVVMETTHDTVVLDPEDAWSLGDDLMIAAERLGFQGWPDDDVPEPTPERIVGKVVPLEEIEGKQIPSRPQPPLDGFVV